MTGDRSTDALERRSAHVQAVHAARRFGAARGVAAVLPELLRICVEATGSDRGTIYLVQGADLVRAALHGDYGPLQPKYDRLPLGSSQTGGAAQAMKPRALTLGDWPEACRADFAEAGFLHNAILPLHMEGKVAGTLNVARTSDRPYTAEELAAAEELALEIAVQIEKARLHDDAQRRVRMLSLSCELMQIGTQARPLPELVRQALKTMRAALDVEEAMLFFLEDGELRLAGHDGTVVVGDRSTYADLERLPLDDSTMSARSVLERRTVLVGGGRWPARSMALAASAGVHEGMATPLIAYERVIGCIGFVRAGDRPFAPDELALIEGCAAHLAVALEHARLFELERSRVHDLELINEVGALVTAQLQLRTVLDLCVHHVALIADAPQVFLMLVDGDTLRGVASNVEVEPVVITGSEPALARQALVERRPLISNDPEHDPRVSKVLVERFGHRALLAIPLLLKGEPLGVLLLGETRSDHGFSSSVVERVVALSNQLATAVGNARLFEDLEKRNQELARAQEQLVQRERLAALGELAAVVAHEVRNPLAVIFNSLATLRRSGADPRRGEKLLGIVGEEAERLDRIVGELLDFARPGEARLAPESLESVIIGATEAATQAVGARVKLEFPERLEPVPLDAQLFRQALINLMANAAQADPGGEIRVRAVAEQREDGRKVARIDISDQGPGIPAGLQAQVFKPFFTTKARGTGLGLAIVKRIVEAHGGQIALAPARPKGTTFTLRVPLDERVD